MMVNGQIPMNGMTVPNVGGYHTIHLNQAMAAQLQQSQHVSPVRVEQMQMQLPNQKAPQQNQQGTNGTATQKNDNSLALSKKEEDKKDGDSDSNSKSSASSKQSEPNSSRSSNLSRSGVQQLSNGLGNMNVNVQMASSPKASQSAQSLQMLAKNGGALNAGAAPFLLAKGMISPPISPRGVGNLSAQGLPLSAQMNQMALPHPQSFAFPPPALPQPALHAHTNWLPVPAAPVHQQHGGQQFVEPNSPFNYGAQQSLMSPMNGHGAQNMMNGAQQNNVMGMSPMMGHQMGAMQHRASPLFTPTQSPQFRPFSH